MSQDDIDLEKIEEEININSVTDEEARDLYLHSSLKWQWNKPYVELSIEQKRTLKKLKSLHNRLV